MKSKRQTKLVELIENNEVETQEELSALLREHGFGTTQATISRDIKELRLVKVAGKNGAYKYALPGTETTPSFSGRLRTIFRESVKTFEAAQNIVVIKTLPGLASAACSAIDAMSDAAVVGSLAGDDTAFLVLRDNAAAAAFCERIRSIME